MTYSAQVLDHFRHPRHAGELASATTAAESSNPVCGDIIKIWIQIEDGKIADAAFKAAGCVPVIAAGSWLIERVQGVTLAEAGSISARDVTAGLGGLPPASAHAAELAVEALRKVLAAAERTPQRPP